MSLRNRGLGVGVADGGIVGPVMAIGLFGGAVWLYGGAGLVAVLIILATTLTVIVENVGFKLTAAVLGFGSVVWLLHSRRALPVFLTVAIGLIVIAVLFQLFGFSWSSLLGGLVVFSLASAAVAWELQPPTPRATRWLTCVKYSNVDSRTCWKLREDLFYQARWRPQPRKDFCRQLQRRGLLPIGHRDEGQCEPDECLNALLRGQDLAKEGGRFDDALKTLRQAQSKHCKGEIRGAAYLEEAWLLYRDMTQPQRAMSALERADEVGATIYSTGEWIRAQAQMEMASIGYATGLKTFTEVESYIKNALVHSYRYGDRELEANLEVMAATIYQDHDDVSKAAELLSRAEIACGRGRCQETHILQEVRDYRRLWGVSKT